MNKSYQLFLLLMLFLSACQLSDQKTPSEKIDVIDLVLENSDFSLELKPLHLTELQLPDSVPGLSGELVLKKIGDIFYVFDQSQQFLLGYNLQGELISRVGEAGGAPDELEGMDDFYVKGNTVSFMAKKGSSTRIKRFDVSGAYLDAFDYPVSCMSFTQMPSGDYLLYTGWNVVERPNRLFVINGEQQLGFFPHEMKRPKIPLESQSFFSTAGGTYFHETFRPTIYEITDAPSVEPLAHLDAGSFTLDATFWDLEPMPAAQMLFEQDYYYCRYFWVSSRYIVLEGILAENQNTEHTILLSAYDREAKKTKSKVLQLSSWDELYLNIFSVAQDTLFSLLDGYAVADLSETKQLRVTNGSRISEEKCYLVTSILLW